MITEQEQKNDEKDVNELIRCIDKYIPKYVAINFPKFYYQYEDIKNDVFIKIVTSKKGFNPEKGKMSTYITRVCRNHIIDLIRKKSKRIEKGMVYLDKYDLIDINNLSYEMEFDVDEEDLRTHVNAIINNLTRMEKYIIDEKYFLGKTNKEIYEYLQIDNKKFKRYLDKIKIKLTDIFENDEFVINYMIDMNIEFNV